MNIFSFVILIAVFLTGCAWMQETKKLIAQNSHLGITVFSEFGNLSDDELLEIDYGLILALGQGLKLNGKDIRVYIVDGILTPAGNYGIPDQDSPTGYNAGKLNKLYPVTITLVRQKLENVRHELVHVLMWQLHGDTDSNHTSSIWKELGVF